MNSIYTSNGTLVVEQAIWSGIRRCIKNADGTYEGFYRTHSETKFKKTGWGKKAKDSFDRAFAEVKAELTA
jgi:hypothetical protein